MIIVGDNNESIVLPGGRTCTVDTTNKYIDRHLQQPLFAMIISERFVRLTPSASIESDWSGTRQIATWLGSRQSFQSDSSEAAGKG